LVSSLPIVAGGIISLFGASTQSIPLYLPDIALYSFLYSGVHSVFLASLHSGFGLILHTETLMDKKSFTNFQLIYPYIFPFLSAPLIYTYWSCPFTQFKSLFSIAGVSSLYLGILLFDYFYVNYKKTLPQWYFNLKLKTTGVALLGLSFLFIALLSNPEVFTIPSKNFPLTLEEIRALT
jgi:hypothetical protein